MPSIPVTCMVCGRSVKDSLFPMHMQNIHSGMTQAEAIAVEKNIPNQQAPIVLDKEAPPTESFMEVAKMLDKKPEPKKDPPVSSIVADTPMVKLEQEVKPIKLEYKYSGQCKDCRGEVATLVVKVKGQTVAVAFCNSHGQLAEQEVDDLDKKYKSPIPAAFIPSIWENETTKDLENRLKRKEVKKHAKQRSKSFVQHKAPVQSSVSTPRLQGNQPTTSGN